MKPAHRFALILAAVMAATFLIVSLILAGTTQLANDNGNPWGSSQSGRIAGDIDGAVFLADDWSGLFPLVIQSVQVMFNRPEDGEYPAQIEDSSQIKVQIYTIEEGDPVLVAESEIVEVSSVDEWLDFPLVEPVSFEVPKTFMAAVKWESGDSDFNGVRAIPLQFDSSTAADLNELDAKNLFHRESIYLPEECQSDAEGQPRFCSYSDLWRPCDPADPECQHERQPGFNMIRVTIDSPAVTPAPPTSTPRPTKTAPTSTPTATALPTPGRSDVYLPAILRNFQAGAMALTLGNGSGEAVSFAITSGVNQADRCWRNLNGDDYPLWVGREDDQQRGTMRSLIWFDVDALPRSSVLLRAELRLMAVEVTPETDESMPIYVHRIAERWPDCPTWTDAATIHAERHAEFDVDSVGQYSVDITGLVRGWISGAYPNYGLMLQTDESVSGRVRGFVSTASTQEDLRPALAVRYR